MAREQREEQRALNLLLCHDKQTVLLQGGQVHHTESLALVRGGGHREHRLVPALADHRACRVLHAQLTQYWEMGRGGQCVGTFPHSEQRRHRGRERGQRLQRSGGAVRQHAVEQAQLTKMVVVA